MTKMKMETGELIESRKIQEYLIIIGRSNKNKKSRIDFVDKQGRENCSVRLRVGKA